MRGRRARRFSSLCEKYCISDPGFIASVIPGTIHRIWCEQALLAIINASWDRSNRFRWWDQAFQAVWDMAPKQDFKLRKPQSTQTFDSGPCSAPREKARKMRRIGVTVSVHQMGQTAGPQTRGWITKNKKRISGSMMIPSNCLFIHQKSSKIQESA